jgi:hypothetical protein
MVGFRWQKNLLLYAIAYVLQHMIICVILAFPLSYSNNLMDIKFLLSSDDSNGDHCSTCRQGSWSTEEEQYTLVLIQSFLLGILPEVASGATLRCFLADSLQCPPMRVSKKLAMGSLAGVAIAKRIGKVRYQYQPMKFNEHTALMLQLRQREQDFCQHMKKSVSKVQPREHLSHVSRVGYWLPEEEAYAWALIQSFRNSFLLTRPPHSTLRAYLASRLQCSPMRISKKLATGQMAGHDVPRKLGMTVYNIVPHLHPHPEFIATARQVEIELARLREACPGLLHEKL